MFPLFNNYSVANIYDFFYNRNEFQNFFLLVSAKKMCKRYKSVVVTLLYAYADYRACHSENQIEPAIRNGEQCEIGCPESATVLS